MAIRNVFEYLEASVQKSPNKTAVADEYSFMTYRQLMAAAKDMGCAVSKCVSENQPVVVFMEKGCYALAALMGTVAAGCFYACVDTGQPAERVNVIIKRLGANVIITDKKSYSKTDKLKFEGKVILADEAVNDYAGEYEYAGEYKQNILSKRREKVIDSDPLYITFTSGSTGEPKGIAVNHRSVIDFIENFTDIFKLNENDVIGNQAPFDFDISVKDIYSALKCTASLQLIPKRLFSFPIKLMDYLENYKVTTLIWAVSAMCIISSLNCFEYKKSIYINKIIFSGEIMSAKHLKMWQEAYPKAMFANVYGPSEITCNCTYYIVDRDFKADEIIPIGRAFPNERVFLLDDSDKLIENSSYYVSGEICVSGTAVSLGYYNDIIQTDGAFVQNPLNKSYREIIYRTGDIGYYNDKGQLCFKARKDSQIKRNGYRIEPAEIERAAVGADGVLGAYCLYDKDGSKLICCYQGSIKEKEISMYLKTKLPKYMLPDKYFHTESVPVNKNGKIDKEKLLSQYNKKADTAF